MKSRLSVAVSIAALALLAASASRVEAQSWQEKLKAGVNKIQAETKRGEHPCQGCGKKISFGNLCVSCATRKAGEDAGKAGAAASQKIGQAADNASASIGDTVGKGVKAYHDAQKPTWQRYLETDYGMATVGGGVLLLIIVIVVVMASRRRQAPAA